MEARIAYGKVAYDGVKTMAALEQYLRTCGLERSLLDLVMLRTSQINGWNRVNIAFRKVPRMYQPSAAQPARQDAT